MRARNLAVAALAVVLTALGATPAQAVSGPEPWQPYTATDFVAPEGKYCAFALAVEAIVDEEEFRVVTRYPDGAERVLEYRGELVTRFTNVATGASVVRDLSGHAWLELYPDGQAMKSFSGIGPFGFGFRAEDDYPQGYYRFDGVTLITIAEDGTRTLRYTSTEENLCDTLS